MTATARFTSKTPGIPLTLVTLPPPAPASGYIVCTEATYQYDAADRPISVTDVYGNTSNFVYDQSGNLISKTDPKLATDANYHTTQYQYDPMNRVTAVTDANGRTTQITYNQRGDVTSVTNPNNEKMTNVYDNLGRLLNVTDNMGNVTSFQYDANGNKTCMKDGNANSASSAPGHLTLPQTIKLSTNTSITINCTVTYIYDALNRLTQTTDANGQSTSYTYNLLGEPLTVTDANSNTTTLAYDDLGRLTTLTDPMAYSVSLVSDEAGNLMQLTDRKGQISQHFYDIMNRRTLSNFEADGTSDGFTFN
jgi:YD repeat-containing protein